MRSCAFVRWAAQISLSSIKYETEEEHPRVEAMLRWQFRLRADDEDVGEVYTQLERDSQMKALVGRPSWSSSDA